LLHLNKLLPLFIIIGLVGFSCEDIIRKDTTPPTVSIQSPVPGSSFSDCQLVEIAVSAGDSKGILQVDFLIDDIFVYSDTSFPYEYEWRLNEYGDGSHVITVYSWDTSENLSKLSSVTVNVEDESCFSKTFGGFSWDEGYSVQQTMDGGFIIAGETWSFGNGECDFWLIKTDAQGEEKWNKTFGGSSYDYSNSVQQATDGGYIITGIKYDDGDGEKGAWLIKTDAQGIKEWSKTFGGANDRGKSVQQTSDGGFIINGYTPSSVDGSDDGWLIKTDSQGNEEWNQIFKGYAGRSVQQTSDDGFIITGYKGGATWSFGGKIYLIKTDPQGNIEWNNLFDGGGYDIGNSVQNTFDGGFIITGTKDYSYEDYIDNVLLIKTDSQGNEEWNQTFGESGVDRGNSVQQTTDGGFIITGSTSSLEIGSSDVWLIKTDSQGNEKWNQTVGGRGYDIGNSVQQTFDGGFIITGYTDSFGNGDRDVWLIKTDPLGNTVLPFE